VWVGGGVAFGPHPRNYEKRVNKKVERLALKRSFTDRVNAGDVIVVEKLQLDSPKTKGMVAFLDKIQAGQNTLVLVDEYDENLDLASRNLPNVLVLKASSVNTYLMLLFKKIVMTDASLRQLGERLA
jgi:large subunit ribosomal protein L4